MTLGLFGFLVISNIMRTQLYFWLLLMFTVCMSYSVSAFEYVVEHHLTVENGLPSNETYFSFSTGDGDIWICTDEGLARFNGIDVRVYTQADGLAGKAVFKGVKDTLGKIWLITSGGISVLKGDSIFTPESNGALISHSKYSTLKDLAVDKNGVVYASTISPNVGVFKIENSSVSFVEFPESIRTGCEEQIFAYKIEPGSYLIGLLVSNHTISCVDTIISMPLQKGLVFSVSNSIIRSGKNQYDLLLNEREIIAQVRNVIGLYNIETNSHVNIILDHDILTLDVVTDKITWSMSDKPELLSKYFRNSLKGYDVSMISDLNWHQTSNLVVCFLNNGVYVFSEASYKEYNLGEDLKLNRISYPVLFDKDKLSVYCDGFFYEYNLDSVSLRGIRRIRKSYRTQDRVFNHISWQGDSVAWFSYAMIQIAPDGDSIHIEPINTRGSYISKVAGLDKQHYVAKSARCLWIKNLSGSILDSFGFPESMSKLFYVKNRWIVISSQDSVYLLEFKKDALTISLEYSYPIKNVSAAFIRGDTLVIGTEDHSVYLLSTEGREVVEISCNLGNNESVKSFAFREDSLYVGTNKQLKLVLFTKPDFSRSVTLLRRPAEQIYLADQKRVYVRSGTSILKLDLHQNRDLDNIQVLINRILYNGEPLYHFNSKILKFYQNDLLVIEPRLNVLINTREHKFKYRLIGRDSVWENAIGNQIWLGRVLPGRYSLEFKETNSTRNQNEISMVMQVEVYPESQDSSIKALVFFAMLVLPLGIGLVFVWLNSKHTGGNRIEVLDLQFKLGTLKMNPHFLYNTLNAIKNLIASNKLKVADHFITSVASLMRDIVDSSNDSLISLDDELKRVKVYVELEKLRQPNLFSFSISVDSQLNLKELQVPPMIIQPLVENSIWHGFGDLSTGAFISIEIKSKGKNMEIRVQDNGRGIADSEKMGSDHTPEGLSNIISRLDSISQIMGKRYSVIFESNRESGTAVTLIIPQ